MLKEEIRNLKDRVIDLFEDVKQCKVQNSDEKIYVKEQIFTEVVLINKRIEALQKEIKEEMKKKILS